MLAPIPVPQTGAIRKPTPKERDKAESERNASRRLLRVADPQARLAFLNSHPFFQDISHALRARLAPQLVRRSCGETDVVVLEQGAEPTGSMDYLFLTPPDVQTKIEVSVVRNWHCRPSTHIQLKLFATAGYDFKAALIQSMELELCPAGTVICKEMQSQSMLALCVFRGEAIASSKDFPTFQVRLSHAVGTSAWASWWGLFELLAACRTWMSEVTAVTDCLMWRLSAEALKKLRKQFPMEIRMLDKVALEHLRLLQPLAPRFDQAPLFSGCNPDFIKVLEAAVFQRICMSGKVVLEEDHKGNELIFIASGRLQRHRGTSEKDDDTIEAGSFFGEVGALGIRALKAPAVVCDSLCDLRVIPGAVLVDALARHPEEVPRFVKLLESNGNGIKFVTNLYEINLFEQFSPEFLKQVVMAATRHVVLRGQYLLKKGDEPEDLIILTHGSVSFENDGEDGVSERSAPAVFASMAVLKDNARMPVSVLTQDLCCFLRVKASSIANLLLSLPPEDRRVMEELARTEASEIKFAMSGQKDFKSKIKYAMSRQGGTRFGLQVKEHDVLELDLEEEEAISELLAKFFEGSEQGFMDALRRGMEKRKYSHGTEILRQGAEGDFAILMHEGSGLVEVNGVRVGEVQAGSLIGEAVLLGNAQTRTATVRASGDVTAFSLSQSVVLKALDNYPQEQVRLEQMMKLRELTNKVLAPEPGSSPNAKSVGFRHTVVMPRHTIHNFQKLVVVVVVVVVVFVAAVVVVVAVVVVAGRGAFVMAGCCRRLRSSH
ncbi:unnamed protein product, partial [Polarella glacialis]